MNFFNNTSTPARKSVSVNGSIIDVASNQTQQDGERMKNNLSWAESAGNSSSKIIVEEEDIIFDSSSVPQVKDLIDPNTERTIASMFVSSQQDSPVVALVKALEYYPRPEGIEKQRKILEENIAKLQKAKIVLSAVTTIAQGVNPDAVKAYTSTEAALTEAMVSRDKFEAELRSSGQSIKQLFANCQSDENYRIAKGIVELYGFSEVN